MSRFQPSRTCYIAFQVKNSASAINSVLKSYTENIMCLLQFVTYVVMKKKNGTQIKDKGNTKMQGLQLLQSAKGSFQNEVVLISE